MEELSRSPEKGNYKRDPITVGRKDTIWKKDKKFTDPNGQRPPGNREILSLACALGRSACL